MGGGISCFFFFKQKTAYEMRISDWSSDVCSSDLLGHQWLSDNAGAGTPDYLDWAVSLTLAVDGIADFKLAYTDTDIKDSECADICDARAVFSVSRSF